MTRCAIGRRGTPAAWVLVVALSAPALAVSYHVSPDVPATLGGATFLPSEVARNDNGAYASALALPAGAAIDAVYRMGNGDWLFSLAAPTTLPDGVTYEPRDVVRYGGGAYALFLDGATAGIPPGANIDALFLAAGDPADVVVSFDAPVTLQGTTYEPADLVRLLDNQWSIFLDASLTNPPIPLPTNVTGAGEAPSGFLVLTFDVPTTLGATTYLPGELVQYAGATFSLYYADPAWPPSARADALSFLAAPGQVPVTMTVDKSTTPGRLWIRWQPGCSWGATDYGIYEGRIGAWYSHEAIDCSDDGGDLEEEIAHGPDDHYYLVVPFNGDDEGSYGQDVGGAERPVGAPACVATQSIVPCP